MSLEGLRAWIGEVERKLGVRTRVFLVLAVIAVGLGGAAIYLAIDARESSVSEGDVQALQEELEARIGGGGGGASAEVTQLESELATLRAEVAELKGEGGKPEKGTGANQGAGNGKSSGGGAVPPSGGTGGGASSTSPPSGGASSERLQELVEKAQQQNTEAEAEQQAGK